MRRALVALAACGLTLGACGYKQDEFSADYATATCNLFEACEVLDLLEYDDLASCKAEQSQTYDPITNVCEGWDQDVAEQCIMEIDQLSCEALYEDVFPTVCDNVCAVG